MYKLLNHSLRNWRACAIIPSGRIVALLLVASLIGDPVLGACGMPAASSGLDQSHIADVWKVCFVREALDLPAEEIHEPIISGANIRQRQKEAAIARSDENVEKLFVFFRDLWQWVSPLTVFAGGSEKDVSFTAIERQLNGQILLIAEEEGENQRLAVPLQRVVQEFADQLRRGGRLSPRQYAYAKILVETHDQEEAQFDASRHDNTVAQMTRAESAEGWDRLSPSEQRFFVSLLEAATGSDKRLLTRAQLDYAERYLRAIDERQKFHAFLDEQLFGHTTAPTRDQIPDFLTIFDAFLRDSWAGSRERRRLLESIPLLFATEQVAWDDQFLAYVRERSPLRDDTPYGSDYSYEETLLVRQLLRIAQRRPEAMDLLTNALLHRQGFRLITPTAVFAVLHALARQHRRSPLSDSVLNRLRNPSAMANAYHWWHSTTLPQPIQRLLAQLPQPF
jgi:hypothetical protein